MARMSPEPLRFRTSTGPEWKRVEEALRVEDATLPDRFKEELRNAADTLVRRTRAAVMRIPVHGLKHTGLRARVGQGVGVKFTAKGVEITASMNQRDEVNLPAYLDQQDGWRHPVFGNPHTWVLQTTGGSWFTSTVEGGFSMVEDEMTNVFEDAAHMIAAAGAGR